MRKANFGKKSNWFIIVLNIICFLVIGYLIFDLSQKRINSGEFSNKLLSLYTKDKNFENKKLGICFNNNIHILSDYEKDVEKKIQETEESKMLLRGFFYNALKKTYETLIDVNTGFKTGDTINFEKDTVYLKLSDIKFFISNLGESGQVKKISKFDASEIVQLGSLFYDHLFWSIVSDNETLNYSISKKDTFQIILKNKNKQLKIVDGIEKEKNGDNEIVKITFHDISNEGEKSNYFEKFEISKLKEGKYSLKYDDRNNIITNKSDNYKLIEELYQFGKENTCFSLKILHDVKI